MPSIRPKLFAILVWLNRGQCTELGPAAMGNAFIDFICRFLNAIVLSLGPIIKAGLIAHHAEIFHAAGGQVVLCRCDIGLELPQPC